MEVRFHPYAVQRMQERNITVTEVQLIIESPDGKIPQSKDKAIFYKKLPNRNDNMVAAVIVEKVYEELTEVVTVLISFEVRK